MCVCTSSFQSLLDAFFFFFFIDLIFPKLLFYGPNELTLTVYMSDAPVKVPEGYQYKNVLEVPLWLTKDGDHVLQFFALSNTFTGKIEYYDNPQGTTFKVRGSKHDNEVPLLRDLQIPNPPFAINQSCLLADGSGAEPWRCINSNLTVVIDGTCCCLLLLLLLLSSSLLLLLVSSLLFLCVCVCVCVLERNRVFTGVAF